MYKSKWFSLLYFNTFLFGEQKVSQFVIFECKWLFSIIIFYFHRSGSSQDRFHTHAFNALSIKLFGEYTEYLMEDTSTGAYTTEVRKDIVKYFPRDSFHKIGNSTGCATILFSGPWKDKWIEWKDGVITEYSWGRGNIN